MQLSPLTLLLLCLALVLAFTLVFAPDAYAGGGSEDDEEEDEEEEPDDSDQRPNPYENDYVGHRIKCTIRQGNGGVTMMVATPADCRRAQERAAAGRDEEEDEEEALPPASPRPAHPTLAEPAPYGPPPGYGYPYPRR